MVMMKPDDGGAPEDFQRFLNAVDNNISIYLWDIKEIKESK